MFHVHKNVQLFMNELHGARGWGVHHPVRDLAIMQESYRQHALIVEKKSYFDQGSEIDVIYSEEEKKTLENVYSTVSEDVKRSLDIDGILTKMIEILSDKRNSSLRAEIHPAHLIIKDCLRPGCNSLNLHGYSDWGLGLGYKARNGNATSADEEEVIRTILSKEDPDVLKETRVWGAGDKMKLIQKVMSCIIKNPAHRRLIRYRRMYKEEDLRGLIDSVITSAVGQRPTMERTSTGKKDSAVRSGSRKQPTQRKITSCEELDNAMRTASKDKTVSRSAGSGHLSSSKPTPHGSDSGTNQSHGKGNTERKSASKVRFADDDTSRERTNALTDDEFAISSSIAPNGDDNTWDDGFEGYFPDWNTDSGDHQSQTPRAVLLQPAVLRAQLPHNPSLDSIKKRLNDVETQPANRNTLATLVLNGEIHLRLDSELQNIADDLKASKWQPGESKPTFPLYLPTSAEAVLHGNVESLQLPFDGKGFAIFIIIGQLFYKRPSGGKLSYEAICIVPGYLREPGGLGVQLFRPDNGTALRLAMNKMYEAGFHRSTLELGEVPHVVVKQFLLYTNIIFQRAQRTSTGAIQISSVSKHEWSTLWGQSLGITYNNQKIKPINSKVYPVRLNTPSSKLLGKDAQAYESMGINKRVAGQFLSKSGRRREVDKVIDLHDEPLIDNAFHSEGTLFIREKRLVESISCLGAKRISPETLIETLKAAKAEFHLNDEQLDAVIALLFCDPSWSLQELSPRPVTLTYVTMDIDQVVGTGQIDADGFREYLSQIGITISPETNLEDGAIKNFIAHFMKILVEEVIMPSEYGDEDQRRKAFCNFIKTRRVSFSEKSVNDGYPKWASSVTGGSRRPVTDCFHVPSILKGTYIFHVAVRFIGESPPRDEGKFKFSKYT